MHGEQNHFDLGVVGAQPLQGFEPTETRHGDVEHHYLRLVLLYLLEDLTAVTRLATDLEIVLRFEQTTKPLANDPVIIGDQYGYHLNRVTAEWHRDQSLFWATATNSRAAVRSRRPRPVLPELPPRDLSRYPG